LGKRKKRILAIMIKGKKINLIRKKKENLIKINLQNSKKERILREEMEVKRNAGRTVKRSISDWNIWQFGIVKLCGVSSIEMEEP